MPRPEQVIPRAPEGSPHGSTAALQRLAQAVGPSTPAPTRPPSYAVGAPLNPEVGEDPVTPNLPEPLALDDDITGLDDLLFSPSERPQEPITAGVPFGPGPASVRAAHESDRQFLRRVARSVATPDAPAAVKRFLARVERGE